MVNIKKFWSEMSFTKGKQKFDGIAKITANGYLTGTH